MASASRLEPLALTFVGGAIGTSARYGLSLLAPTRPGQWPVGTFVANLLGALALGALLEGLVLAGADTGWRKRARLLIGTGFCGGLTTYSTFAVESDLLVRHHASALAAGYVLATIVAGLAATIAGIALAGGHRRRREERATP